MGNFQLVLKSKKPRRAFYQGFDFLAFPPFGAATFLLI